jgi:prepilin-type N-terminal cleavage/methylation domain-containing protein
MPRSTRSPAFTLVEILVVVVILGILAAIVIPQFVGATRETKQGAFVNDIRVFSDAALLYHHETGEWVEDSASGALPAGLGDYIEAHKWTNGTPIGGLWDAERDGFGHISAIGVHFNNGDNPGDDYMLEIDRRYDDGNLATGGFRKIAADRYYKIVAE